jgi:hypothetical protein
MQTNHFLARLSGLALGTCFLAAACTEQPAPLSPPSFAASSSSLPHINNTEVPIPVSVVGALTAEDCSNNPGPYITLEGAAVLGGFGVEMTFTNNLKGTHEYTADNKVDITLSPAGQSITIPKQPVLGGTGGNPFIWIQFVGGDGTPVSDEIYIGRCVQGSRYGFSHAQATSGSAFANFEVTSCENSPGPYINMDAGIGYEGLGVQVIFRNNDNPVGGPHEATRSKALTVIPSGLSYTFPKQPVMGGVGGNPWIFAGFTDGVGTALGEATLLGRCEQLSKAVS